MRSQLQTQYTSVYVQARNVNLAVTYLSLLDWIGCSLFKHLDGLVVVQRASASDHVTQELNTVQLTIRVLGSRVIHEADLGFESWHVGSEIVELFIWKQNMRVWSIIHMIHFLSLRVYILCLESYIGVWHAPCRIPGVWGGPFDGSSYPCPCTPNRWSQEDCLDKRWPPGKPAEYRKRKDPICKLSNRLLKSMNLI